jgi:hypothetical protein
MPLALLGLSIGQNLDRRPLLSIDSEITYGKSVVCAVA